jgi:hypothetical protein
MVKNKGGKNKEGKKMSKYELSGNFANGEPWREDANNLKELKFVCDKLLTNRVAMGGGFKILKNGKIVTTEIMRIFYWED